MNGTSTLSVAMKQAILLVGLLFLAAILWRLFALGSSDATRINIQWRRCEELANRIDVYLNEHGRLPPTLEEIANLPVKSYSVEKPSELLSEFRYPAEVANVLLARGETNVPVLFQRGKAGSRSRRGLVCYVRPAVCRVIPQVEIELLLEGLEKERK